MTGTVQSGFFSTLRGLTVSQTIMAWDFGLSMGISVLVAGFLRPHWSGTTESQLVEYLVVVSAALFGVLLAGLAIVAAITAGRLADAIADRPAIGENLLKHFLFVGGLLVAAIVSSVAYQAVQIEVLVKAEWPIAIVLGVAVWLTFWALFASFEILKLVYAVAMMSMSSGASSDGS